MAPRRWGAVGAALLLGACGGASGHAAGSDRSVTVAATLLSSSPLPPATATPAQPASTAPPVTLPTVPTPTPAAVAPTPATPAQQGQGNGSGGATVPSPPAAGPGAVPGASAVGPRTACRQVAHIGDSTSEYLWSAGTVGGDPDATLDARYRAVGVVDVVNETSGGRAMIERIDGGQRNAVEVAADLRASGFSGCWVLMIGTNDAANVAAGANTGLAERIERLLTVIDGEPVLWVNASSASAIPFYGDDAMQAFDAVLDQVAAAHPNVWVLDWASIVRPDWYGPDGLHYGPTGRAWRSALTAQELAVAFPA